MKRRTRKGTSALEAALLGEPIPDITTYRSMVGGLQYLTLTRPDLAFALNQVCQYMHAPRASHLQAGIFRYINGSINLGLTITPSADTTLCAFTDADWAGNPDDRRSTTGASVFLRQIHFISSFLPTRGTSKRLAAVRLLTQCSPIPYLPYLTSTILSFKPTRLGPFLRVPGGSRIHAAPSA